MHTFTDVLNHPITVANTCCRQRVDHHLDVAHRSLAVVLLMCNALHSEQTRLRCHTAEARRGRLGDGVLSVERVSLIPQAVSYPGIIRILKKLTQFATARFPRAGSSAHLQHSSPLYAPAG